MNGSTEMTSEAESGPSLAARGVSRQRGNWKPVLTLLLLAPAVGELLSGSSPPLQFFNPLFLLLLVWLYGCGALLVRETVRRWQLSAVGLLLLGAAYGCVEEGLTCKSFFNPFWTDTGFLSVYGRAWRVNWVWTFGLTAYHMVVSIAAPVVLTEALFEKRSAEQWLTRRGWVITSICFALVVILGFVGFDNRQFHLIEINDPISLARRLRESAEPLPVFIFAQFNDKDRAVLHKADLAKPPSPELRHALQDELNRLLPRADLYTAERFASATSSTNQVADSKAAISPQVLASGRGAGAHFEKSNTAAKEISAQDSLSLVGAKLAGRQVHGDKLVELNRRLLEAAFPAELAARRDYPFRPGWGQTLGCVAAIGGLVWLALRQKRSTTLVERRSRPWLKGVSFTVLFVLCGFVLPSLAEHGTKIPAFVDCLLWLSVAFLTGRALAGMEGPDGTWRRGLWGLGVISPWVFWALLLGIFVKMIGAKSFLGMPIVALGFATGIVILALSWRKNLDRAPGS